MAHQNTSKKTELNIILIDSVAIIILSIVVFYVSARYDTVERLIDLFERYEAYELDEFFTVSIFLTICFGIFSYRRLREVNASRQIIAQKNRELTKALEEIKVLKGIVPICSFCKKIRDDKGYWQKVETYIEDHSEAEFSHSICDDCMEKHYPELNDEEE